MRFEPARKKRAGRDDDTWTRGADKRWDAALGGTPWRYAPGSTSACGASTIEPGTMLQFKHNLAECRRRPAICGRSRVRVLLALVALSLLGVDGCSRSHARPSGAKVSPPSVRFSDGGSAPAPSQPSAAGSAGARAGPSSAASDAATPTQLLECDVLTLVWNWSPGVDRCAIDLMPAASPTDGLLLVVTEGDTSWEKVPRDLGNGAGWMISVDGAHVELLGALCGAAHAGRFSSIRFQMAASDTCRRFHRRT